MIEACLRNPPMLHLNRLQIRSHCILTPDPSVEPLTLTWVAEIEVVLIVFMTLVMPLLCIRLVVVLHQRAEEDDEDDLQDEAGDRQLQPHVGRCVRHVVFPQRDEQWGG